MKNEDLHSDIVDQFIKLEVKGGQMSSGAQKDGFLKYDKGRPIAAYDPTSKEYIAFESFATKCDDLIGHLPEGALPWKKAVRLRNKEEVFGTFFENMKTMETLGAQLAVKYGVRSNEIGKSLVTDGVAANEEDVNTVMLTGFFHAYGPVNDFFN